MKVAVVGAGVIGHLCALRLARAGAAVTLYERGRLSDPSGASSAAAGMLAPLSEALAAGPGEGWVYALGKASVADWQELVASLPERVFMADAGTLVGARPQDEGEVIELWERARLLDPEAAVRLLDREEVAQLEPALAETLSLGLHVPGEGCVHTWQALAALGAALRADANVTVKEGVAVRIVAPFRVDSAEADHVVDCRGLGARDDLRDLRGVRGEIVEIEARGVQISRPTRVPHARYPLYVVPRGDGRYLVGATSLESEDDGPVTVTSALELLSAAHGLCAGFRVAGVTRHVAGVRPAFFDNLPRVESQPGLLTVNGLYRHGFLLGPVVSAAVTEYLMRGEYWPDSELFRRRAEERA